MRVSLLIFFLAGLFLVEAENPSFDQMGWNLGVERLLGGIWVNEFGSHFTPAYFAANVTRETRLMGQFSRLRARVGTRLIESLESSEIICQQDYFSVEAFVQVEKELKEKGWDAHWIPKTLPDECGSQSKGFLYVKN